MSDRGGAIRYHELVIEGPRGWTFGFIEGFLRGRGAGGEILDAEAEGVQCAPLRERIQEVLNPGAEIVHLLAPEEVLPLVREAAGKAAERGRPVEVRHERPIVAARFSFSLNVYSQEEAKRIRALFEGLPPGVALAEGTRFEEVSDPGAKGLDAYAPAHDFELRARGGVEGALEGVLAVYRRCREEALIRAGAAELLAEGEGGP